MLIQVFLEEFYRRFYPADSRIGNEHVSSDPHHYPSDEGFLLVVHDVDFAFGSLFAGQVPVYGIDFGDGAFDNFRTRRDVSLEASVKGLAFGIFRSIDDGLPSFGGKILGELHPPLDAGTSGRRPII
jgi:hypothetical protein